MRIHSDEVDTFSRRRFLSSGVAALPLAALPVCANSTEEAQTVTSHSDSDAAVLTGNGEWTYQVAREWGKLPTGTQFGGTHGGIAQDQNGHVYVSTQSETGVLVYGPDGALLETISHEYPEIHSMVHVVENGDQYFYATVQKGTPRENWLFVKIKTDGTVVQKITAPPEAGFKAPNEWRLTAAVPAPDGSVFIANGYGDSRIFQFDNKGQYKASFGGLGSSDGLMKCCHGLTIDTRYDQPLLLVCDRENRRLCHFDFDRKFVGTIAQHLRRPCQVSFYHDYAVISELEGRVTILDKDNEPIAFLGDNPRRDEWANYELRPDSIPSDVFSAAHGVFIDENADIYVSDWNQVGRVTKLTRKRT